MGYSHTLKCINIFLAVKLKLINYYTFLRFCLVYKHYSNTEVTVTFYPQVIHKLDFSTLMADI